MYGSVRGTTKSQHGTHTQIAGGLGTLRDPRGEPERRLIALANCIQSGDQLIFYKFAVGVGLNF